jgi:hypothetical protein
MRKISLSQWALVAAALLGAAAAMGATFAHGSGTAQITPAQVKRIADAEIRRLAPTLTVKSARSPAFYAHVAGNGSVNGAAQGITSANITHPSTGIYCFSGLAAAPKGGMAILDAVTPPPTFSGPDLVQVGVGTINRCPSGTQAVVATFGVESGFLDDPFIVMFWS